jgi:pyruvate/2-oxoglutarate/acetoin dehydrogenase E1 component
MAAHAHRRATLAPDEEARGVPMTLAEAIRDALRQKMLEDHTVYLLGEDIGRLGGFFHVTEGLMAEYGENRVIDMPLNETAIVGAAIGMALAGLRPVVEIQQMDFIYPAADQIINELAKIRYRSGGQFSAPVVIRTPYGGGIRGGLYHSQSSEAMFLHVPGLKVVTPSTPADAKGLLMAAMEADDPVLFLEPRRLYSRAQGEVLFEAYRTPIGVGRIARHGGDVTLIAYGAMVPVALEAAETLSAVGLECEVLDLRSLNPWDQKLVFDSVARTRRVAILHEAPVTCGFGAELSACISEELFDVLLSPVLRIGGFDVPYPFALEHLYDIGPRRVERAIKQLLAGQ